jgi:hypothetical protein
MGGSLSFWMFPSYSSSLVISFSPFPFTLVFNKNIGKKGKVVSLDVNSSNQTLRVGGSLVVYLSRSYP